MKVIFLDIDGVLNLCRPERDEYGSLFHENFVENLKMICEKADAKIVISSSWRLSGLSIMQEMWKCRGLPGEVIDITPCFMNERGTTLCRGDEVQEWIDKNNPSAYVYIDDDFVDVNESQLNNFVQTSGNHDHSDHIQGYGLTKECALKAIDILNKGDQFK